MKALPMQVEWGMVLLVTAPLIAAAASVALAPLRTLLAGLTILSQLAAVTVVTRHVYLAGPVRYEVAGWGAPLGIDLFVDGLSAFMLILTATVAAGVSAYAGVYFNQPSKTAAADSRHYFWPVFLVAWASLNALFLSGDLFNWYVTLELLTLSAISLIGLSGNVKAITAALRYLIAAMCASLSYLLGVVLLYSQYGTVDWYLLSQDLAPGWAASAAIALITVALMLKTALFPLHFWLPAAHSNAPAPVSALLSGVVVKASFYILFRLWTSVFSGMGESLALALLGGFGGCAVLWGSVQALRQTRVKLMLAYSSVAQLGYLFLVFALIHGEDGESAWKGAAFLALSHALAKSAAFMATGALMLSIGTDVLTRWRGAGMREPVATFALALACVSLMGLPPSGGFIGKWSIVLTALSQSRWDVVLVMLLGGLMTALYVFKILGTAIQSVEESADRQVEVPPVLQWTPLLLASLAILLGLAPHFFFQLLDVGSPF